MATKKTTTPSTANLTAAIYDQKGKSADTIALPEKVFGLPWNADLVHQVVVGMQANKRAGTAHTKDRSDVSGGGKKPWKQKGTGRARHGSTRSPIWVGGGITFGPRNDKDYSKKINKKMRVKALFTILSRKLADENVLFVDSMTFDAIKTKEAAKALSALAAVKGFEKITSKKATNMLLVLPERNDVTEKSFANLPGVTAVTTNDLNALNAMNFNHIVVVDPETVTKALAAKMS